MDNIRALVPPKSKLKLFRLLCTGQLRLNPLWEKWSYRCKFALRSIFLSHRTFNWLGHLANYRLLGYYLSRQTNLPCKLQRPYLASCMSNKDCLQALIDHYDFLDTHSDNITQQFYGETPYILAEIEGKNNHELTVSIQAEDKYAREGELSLYLRDKQGVELATLTFSIIQYHGQSTLFIAGMQGSNIEQAREVIQQTTKACYGLFPKRLILESALVLAEIFKIKQIIAVSNRTHIYNNFRYRRRFKKMHSDYDNFWQSIDGQENSEGLYILPNQINRKSMEEIASKKRSEYRNRYLLLDNLSSNIHQQLNKLV